MTKLKNNCTIFVQNIIIRTFSFNIIGGLLICQIKSENSNEESKNNFETSGDFLKTLDRGLMVIKSFQNSPSLTISESAVLSGLSRPVTRRVLLTLEHLGYANSKDGRFSLTTKILSLGYSYLSSHNIWEIAQPYLKKLSKKIE